jgi:putative (di)nucleoside polyphosphate hydrolase
MEPEQLLLADLEHFGGSLWRNEEVGEKRLTFFVSLLTAVAAGLVALAASGTELGDELFDTTATAGMVVLLVIGLLTYLRMIQRNRVRDEYQRTLAYIRLTYRALCPELATYEVPHTERRYRFPTWLRGGYAETFAAIDGLLLAVLLVLTVDLHVAAATGVGAVLTAALWWLSGRVGRVTAIEPTEGAATGQYFRAGVGAVITHGDGRVLTLERSDVPAAWQLPQGGVERGEDDLTAAIREVGEETGIPPDALRLVAAHPEPLAYELPVTARSVKTGRGQVHTWFVFRFEGRDEEVAPPEGGEFRSWAWRPFDEVVAQAAEFRRPSYRRLQTFTASLLEDP